MEDIILSNWIDFYLDVLATSPSEIQRIEKALQQPSNELLAWEAERWNQRVEEIAADVKNLVTFKPVKNLVCADPKVNKARRFSNAFKDRFWGLVIGHVCNVSEQFPNTIFLLEYWSLQASSAGKIVIRAGDEIRYLHDGNQQAQGYAWALLDIFAPYRAEHNNELEFGSLWDRWLENMGTALEELRNQELAPPDTTAR